MVWYIERCQKHTLLKKNYQKKRNIKLELNTQNILML